MPAPVISIASGNDAEFRKSLDRFGYLDTRYREAKPWIDERDALKKSIQAKYEKSPAGDPIRATGNLYHVDLKPREMKREVTSKPKAFAALKKAIGLTALMEGLTYTFKLIDPAVSKQGQKAFVALQQTGSRDVSAVLIAAPEAA